MALKIIKGLTSQSGSPNPSEQKKDGVPGEFFPLAFPFLS
jgi:hypothetical protein